MHPVHQTAPLQSVRKFQPHSCHAYLLGQNDYIVCLGNGFHNCIPIQRNQCTQIQNLCVDAFLRQLFRCLQCKVYLTAPCYDCNICTPLFSHPQHPEGWCIPLRGICSFFAYSSLCSIKITGSSSRIADFSKPFASSALEGATNLQTGCVAENIFKALRMLPCVSSACAHGQSQYHGYGCLSACHISHLLQPD